MIITTEGPTDSPSFDLGAFLERFPRVGEDPAGASDAGLPVYLSWGFGVESTAALVEWLVNPESRDFPLSRLTVMAAQTGDEWFDTKQLSETFLFPLLRLAGVRVVQVARAGHLEEDGIEVLDDTREPHTLFIDGAYRLSDEMLAAGTVPQYGGGVHKCALKFKAFPLTVWLADDLERGACRHAFGYNSEELGRIEKSEYWNGVREGATHKVGFGFNAEETGRISRATEYDGLSRVGFYPLMDWGWNRQRCLDYLWDVFGVRWEKSACIYCPFNALKDGAVERLRREPERVARALLMEHSAMCMNPRSSLYSGKTLLSVIERDGNDGVLAAFERTLEAESYGYYRVRRIYSQKGKADRCVERLAEGGRRDMDLLFEQDAMHLGFSAQERHRIVYGYVREREAGVYPTREEFYVVAPARAATKARYGLPWFEGKWAAQAQAALF